MPQPIDISMYEYHQADWPGRALARATGGAAQTQRLALGEARAALEDCQRVRDEVLADQSLSGQGKKAKLDAWAAQRLPALRARLQQIADDAASVERTITDGLTKKLIGSGDAPHAREIRDYLKSIPDALDRADFVRKLMKGGDLSAVRAVLTAPHYLSNLEIEAVEDLRQDALAHVDPEQHEHLGHIRKGRDASGAAVKAALAAIEAGLAEPLERGPAVNAPVRPAPPSKEEVERVRAAILAGNNSPETLAALGMSNDSPQAA